MLLSVCPKLPMKDIGLTRDFYINKLGFQEVSNYNDYIIFKKDDIEIHFFEFSSLNVSENYGQVYIRTRNIENIYKIYLDKKVIHPNGHLEIKSWGQKEFFVLAPDNNLLNFIQKIN